MLSSDGNGGNFSMLSKYSKAGSTAHLPGDPEFEANDLRYIIEAHGSNKRYDCDSCNGCEQAFSLGQARMGSSKKHAQYDNFFWKHPTCFSAKQLKNVRATYFEHDEENNVRFEKIPGWQTQTEGERDATSAHFAAVFEVDGKSAAKKKNQKRHQAAPADEANGDAVDVDVDAKVKVKRVAKKRKQAAPIEEVRIDAVVELDPKAKRAAAKTRAPKQAHTKAAE